MFNHFVRVSLLALFFQECVAQSPVKAEEKDATSPGWATNSFYWLEEQRDFLSKHVSSSATAFDNYIARDTFDGSGVNESYIRLRVSQSTSSGFDEEFDVSIKGKLDVPNSKKRVKLFIDSEPDDFDSISQRRRDVSGSAEKEDDSTVAGLSFWGNTKKTWKPNLSVGMRLKVPLDPYLKAKVSRYDELSGLWQSRFVQSASYYDSKGWKSSTEYDVYRPIDEEHMFRITNEAQYINSDKRWEFYHGYSFYQKLDKKTAIEYSASVSGVNRPNPRVNALWLRLEWRKRLYKDWLFGKIAPEMSFPRSRDFSDTYSLFFELEVFFSEHYKK